MFLDPAAAAFYDSWNRLADDTVALLRAKAGRNPYDKALTDLIGELSTRSEPFRTRWADHNVRFHRSGVKKFHHSVVGMLTLTYEVLEVAADSGLVLNAYSAEPGTADADALHLLASWSATEVSQANKAKALGVHEARGAHEARGGNEVRGTKESHSANEATEATGATGA